MRIPIADDHQDVVGHLPCYGRLQAHAGEVLTAPLPGCAAFVRRAADADARVLIRERTRVDAALLARLPRLRLISRTGRIGEHLDLAACTARGITAKASARRWRLRR